MGLRLENFAFSTITVSLAPADTTIVVTGGTGVRFPVLVPGDYFYATLENAAAQREIVRVTERVADTFTVVRGVDDTTALSWSSGDSISLRLNKLAIIESLGTVADGGISTVKLTDNAVTFAKFQDVPTGTLLGRVTAGTGDVEALTEANYARINRAQNFSAVQRAATAAQAISSTSTFNFIGGAQVTTITLTTAITLTFGAPSGIVDGAFYTFRLTAGDTAARTFAWNSAYKFPAATPPLTAGTVSSGASDIITFLGGPSNTLLFVGFAAGVR